MGFEIQSSHCHRDDTLAFALALGALVLSVAPSFRAQPLFARLFLLEDADLGMFDRAHTCTVPDRYLWLTVAVLLSLIRSMR